MNSNAFDTTAAEWSVGRVNVLLWVAVACVVAALLCAFAGERLLHTSGDLGPDENLKRTDRLILY